MKMCSLVSLVLAMLFSQRLPAAVVYMSLAGQPDNFLRTGYPDRFFDFNGDGRNELLFRAEGLGTAFVTVDPQDYTDVRIYNDRGAAILGYDEIIDVNATLFPGTNFINHSWGAGGNTQLMSYFHSGASGGPWNGREGYLGFYFNDLERLVSNFGWMRITDHGGALEFHEWAYETEDSKPIYAGQIPEPTTAACLLGALLVALRRCRDLARTSSFPR